ncbi:MAG: tRNA (adenosine(37)-N6)-threonylcarbamoyltransferase complex ATPase subunit type 1 TsaE [Nitrospirales bacterium]|nr:tRNA (adenosine(37)-N6)-threonylcarbamoyltransferase complex ATPase subunit type 1 TsaE [Nitrospira sp.]MDR4501581.1 tRNA (adenosine(37)-N6)-threonylcarbamoyltransferase complex ATPase subunit type 1 TsaE [Nitrospirales bacterium]
MSTLAHEQTGDEWTITLASVTATEQFGHAVGSHCTGGEIIALRGDLGAGKTVMVRSLAAAVGIDSTLVTSPTFTLIHEYEGRLRVIHADLYRIDTPQELAQIGLHEYFSPSSLTLIEWAERMGDTLPPDYLEIELEHRQPTERKATIRATGLRSRDLARKALEQWTSNW